MNLLNYHCIFTVTVTVYILVSQLKFVASACAVQKLFLFTQLVGSVLDIVLLPEPCFIQCP